MMPLAILCGGHGSRLGKETEHIPKCLVDVAGKPFLWHQLGLLYRAGYRDAVLLTGIGAAQVTQTIGYSRVYNGIKCRTLTDGAALKGTAGALRQAIRRGMLQTPCVVLYGDSYLDCDYGAIERHFWNTRTPIAESSPLPLLTEWDGVDYGIAILTHQALWAYPQIRQLPDLYDQLTEDEQLIHYPMPQPFREIGSPAGLDALRRDLAKDMMRAAV